MNDKGVTYIEVLAVLGITAIITAATVSMIQDAKEKAISKTNEYIETVQGVDKKITGNNEIEKMIEGADYGDNI